MFSHLILSGIETVELLMAEIRAPGLNAKSSHAKHAKKLISAKFPRARLFLAYELYWGNTFALRDTQKAMKQE